MPTGIVSKAFDTVGAVSSAAGRAAEARAEMVTKIVVAMLVLLALVIVFALNPLYAIGLVVLGLVGLWLYMGEM